MPHDFLHKHPEFADLIRIVAEEKGINAALVEKDYWIMQCLYGLQEFGFRFQLKGGTSLSKGHQIIGRFSEDIDILVEPPASMEVKTGRHQNKAAHIQSRRNFYRWLTEMIEIEGIVEAQPDEAFDDLPNYRSAGIRLIYESAAERMDGLRDGVLLEVGFDQVAPNEPKDISSWLYDRAVQSGVEIIDNRAKGVLCYDPAYTFVEKLQTVSTKFRKQQEDRSDPVGFMRHYYDIHELLRRKQVQDFVGTDAYKEHKQKRFRQADNQDIAENQAFLLTDPLTRKLYADAYDRGRALYYADGTPTFEEIMTEVGKWVGKL